MAALSRWPLLVLLLVFVPPASLTADELRIEELAPGVWRHISYQELEGIGPFPSNGLIVRSERGVILIDTAWGLPATVELLDRVTERFGRIELVVVTHFHDDRLGGIAEVHDRGIPTLSLRSTARLAVAGGWPRPLHRVFRRASLNGWGVAGEIFYPGPGHTPDNAVVWLAEARVLFGGCLVRRAGAKGLGNLEDAVPEGWAATIARLERRYPQARIVVPGHGPPGDFELLPATRRLAEDHSSP
ncbi:MAG: subclass B1 metallo-beta-lactamase [Acidobacteriota bacterium]